MSDASEMFPAFTLLQLGALTAWSAALPHGFQVRLVIDHHYAEELAELVQHDECKYTLNPTTDGGVALISTDWRYCREVDTVEAALAALLVREKELEAEAFVGIRDGGFGPG
jgi:demethoxyubiquinone hydroxylase (CLK1/Coq7/Cat5 family)